MKRPVDVVMEFLESERARGKTHVLLDDGARDGLRELFVRSHPKMLAKRPASPAPSPYRNNSDALKIEGTTRSEQLASLWKQAIHWHPVIDLGSLRKTLIFSDGSPDARLMFVGESPGYEEERKQLPFMGPAGQKLNDILRAMGLSRDQVYLTMLVKFRPAMENQTTNNRRPTPDEIQACLPLLKAEISIIRPQCIIALGGTVAEAMLGLSGNVTTMRETWHTFGDCPVRVTFHPSYLLQSSANLRVKRQVWEDMLAVMEQINLPITPKQRGFFLEK